MEIKQHKHQPLMLAGEQNENQLENYYLENQQNRKNFNLIKIYYYPKFIKHGNFQNI